MTKIKHVSKRFSAPLFSRRSGDGKKFDLLWGDRVEIIDESNSRWKVKARGMSGYMNPDHLWTSDKSLLELYFIDVGQGDGVLIRTPDHKHILIDGGWPRKSQPSGKNAADFVDWKFKKDYGMDAIFLDAMICSHNDQDHYGGLWDLLDGDQHEELNCEEVFVDQFYHAGLSWWRSSGGRTLGPKKEIPAGKMFTRLMEDRESLEKGLRAGGNHAKFQGEWAKFLKKVKEAKNRQGDPTPVTRLHSGLEFLPGYNSNNPAREEVGIRILAPVDFDLGNGKRGIRYFSGGTSKNTNGNSVLLKMEYGKVKIILTGDLNTKSQHALLEDYRGQEDIFECDIAKACHHGSDDVSINFLDKLKPACTIISSGDSEGHDHPRPSIIAASGITGHRTVIDDQLVTPLVFSTEIARSIALGKITKIENTETNEAIEETDFLKYRVSHEVVTAGARNPVKGSTRLGKRRMAVDTTYGLINVRTDGKTIMCAALNEKDKKWNINWFNSRF